MRISVVIPSYNHAPFLRAAIDSALNQIHPPHEVVVVDDGSTDQSRDILSQYESEVTVVLQDNRGTYATLNEAVRRTSGDWIAIQNSDDEWDLQKLRSQADLTASNPDVGLVHTGFVYIDESENITSTPLLRFPEYSGEPVADLHSVLLRYNPIVISSALFSRSAWEKVGPFDERYHGAGDWEFCLRVGEQFLIGYVEEPLTRVRRHSGNASTDASRIPSQWLKQDCKLMAAQTTLHAAETLYRKAIQGRTAKHTAAVALAALGVIYSRAKQPGPARKIYSLSARLAPLRLKTYLRYALTLAPNSIQSRIPQA